MKGKEKADRANVLVRIHVRHPLVGFTCPRTPVEYKKINICHHFEVPKKGKAEKPIIFHTLRDMDRRKKHKDKFDPSTRDNISEGRYSFKAKMVREEVERDFRQIRDYGGIPLF